MPDKAYRKRSRLRIFRSQPEILPRFLPEFSSSPRIAGFTESASSITLIPEASPRTYTDRSFSEQSLAELISRQASPLHERAHVVV